MQVKTTTKLRKELQTIRINFIEKGTSLKRFCAESSIDDSNVYKIFNGTWKGEKATELKARLLNASKGKTDFLTEPSSSQAE